MFMNAKPLSLDARIRTAVNATNPQRERLLGAHARHARRREVAAAARAYQRELARLQAARVDLTRTLTARTAPAGYLDADARVLDGSDPRAWETIRARLDAS